MRFGHNRLSGRTSLSLLKTRLAPLYGAGFVFIAIMESPPPSPIPTFILIGVLTWFLSGVLNSGYLFITVGTMSEFSLQSEFRFGFYLGLGVNRGWDPDLGD